MNSTLTRQDDFNDQIFNRLPENIKQSLNDIQKRALAQAVNELKSSEWSDNHKIDLRYSVPLPSGRHYIRIFAGLERRPILRISKEQNHSFLRSFGKILLIGIVAAIFYTLAGLSVLFFSSVLT